MSWRMSSVPNQCSDDGPAYCGALEITLERAPLGQDVGEVHDDGEQDQDDG